MYRITCCALLMLTIAGCGGREAVTVTGQTMGTTYSVKVVGTDLDAGVLRADIEAELRLVNDLMSTYLADSEISRFNAAPVGTFFDLSPGTLEVLGIAERIFEQSNGAFDPTVGPLVNLWGFGPDPGDRAMPTDAEIEAALARVGMHNLLRRDNAVARLTDTYLDLSAIAKGYGVDRIAALLDARGAANYLVEIGGELSARGVNDRGQPWRIAIERPDIARRVPYRTFAVRDRAMATSGDYRNYYEVDGERYSHTIDPATGRPVTHTLASVTVIADSCAEADGLATAINVMGPDAGLDMAREKGIAAFAIIKTAGGFEESYTPAIEAYLK